MTEHTTSYYAASANAYEPFPTLSESISCDVCVVGGGYTGLSSALHLAEMGYDVVLLEGARIGFGASGRNGGQLVNSYSRDIDVIEKNYGPDAAKVLGSMMFEGGEIIRERIQRYQIQCDYRPGGLFVALNHKQLETLEEQKANGNATATRSWSCWMPARSAGKSTANAIPARCWTAAGDIFIRSTWRSAKRTPFALTAGGCMNNPR